MAERDGHLHEVLSGYAKFLQDKNLSLDKHQPYLVRWVREFLLFARTHAGYSFEQTLDLFLADVGGRVGTKPWQLQQASDAMRVISEILVRSIVARTVTTSSVSPTSNVVWTRVVARKRPTCFASVTENDRASRRPTAS